MREEFQSSEKMVLGEGGPVESRYTDIEDAGGEGARLGL